MQFRRICCQDSQEFLLGRWEWSVVASTAEKVNPNQDRNVTTKFGSFQVICDLDKSVRGGVGMSGQSGLRKEVSNWKQLVHTFSRSFAGKESRKMNWRGMMHQQRCFLFCLFYFQQKLLEYVCLVMGIFNRKGDELLNREKG